MFEKRLWFEQAVDGLFRIALREKMSPMLARRLREVGIDLDKPLMPSYPAEVWTQAVRVAAQTVYPSDPPGVALYKIGEIFARGYTLTLMGKALFMFMRTLGAKRTLPKLGRNLRNVTNYIDVQVEEALPGCFVIRFNDVGDIPEFYQGLVDASGQLLGAIRETEKTFIYENSQLTLFVDLNLTREIGFAGHWYRAPSLGSLGGKSAHPHA